VITAADAPYLSRPGPNLAAGLLALGVHAVFVLLLVVGVSWQTQHPAPVMVDLWAALPDVPRPPAPPVEPLPVPPRPAPPKPAPVPKPAVKEAPPPKPPDIALEKEKARKKAEAEKLEKLKAMQAAEAKALADAAREEAAAMKKAQEQQLADKERKKRELLRQLEEEELMQRMADEEARQNAARAAAARRLNEVDRIKGQYQDMIRATVRGNTRLPPDLQGNPEVRFTVKLLPTGEVVDVRRTQSSGNAAYDEAVERAIRKSSPLPLPADRDARAAFVPELSFVHRPKE
jgi:colicin import membrane protein